MMRLFLSEFEFSYFFWGQWFRSLCSGGLAVLFLLEAVFSSIAVRVVEASWVDRRCDLWTITGRFLQ